VSYPDGTLITPQGGAGVDVISRGIRHWIPDPPTFEALGFVWGDIKAIPAAEFNAIPQGLPLVSIVAPPASQGLRRLEDTRPAYAPVGSNFQSIVAQGLGNAGTAGDGFDMVIAAPILALADDANAISELDTFLSLADFVDGDFETGSLSDTVLNLAGFFAGGDSLLTHLGL
jgi:hypothetical protein